MKIYLFPGCLAILILAYCTSPESKNGAYHIVPTENPVFYPDTVFVLMGLGLKKALHFLVSRPHM